MSDEIFSVCLMIVQQCSKYSQSSLVNIFGILTFKKKKRTFLEFYAIMLDMYADTNMDM